MATTDARIYVLIPRSRPTGLPRWIARRTRPSDGRTGIDLRAAVAAPVARLADIAAARGEVDRVLDRPGHRASDAPWPSRELPCCSARSPTSSGPARSCTDPRLQTLIDDDREREAALADSVEEYLHRFGDVRAAADDLHIHPNTLRYRVRRAEQILGMSLDDPDSRLLLQIQLLIRHPIR